MSLFVWGVQILVSFFMEKKVSKNHLGVLFSGLNSFLSYILISRTVYVVVIRSM
jgi:hypothetical protein